jgi:hypothetical protein
LEGPVIPALQLDFVAVTETDGVLIVGFADDPFETTAYFMLQRAKPPTDDEVCFERDGQESSGYSRVSRWTLTRYQLELELEESLASRLELPNAFVVRFQCDDAAFQQLGAALSRVFSGKGPP